MTNRRYVVGYDSDKGFVVLHDTDSAKVAVAMRRALEKKRKEELKIKKRA